MGDLLIFTNGTAKGVDGICQALNKFYTHYGLQLNLEKTEIFFFVSVSPDVRSDAMAISDFKEGKLLVRYLGVPFISGKLTTNDCDLLMEKITARVKG